MIMMIPKNRVLCFRCLDFFICHFFFRGLLIATPNIELDVEWSLSPDKDLNLKIFPLLHYTYLDVAIEGKFWTKSLEYVEFGSFFG